MKPDGTRSCLPTMVIRFADCFVKLKSEGKLYRMVLGCCKNYTVIFFFEIVTPSNDRGIHAVMSGPWYVCGQRTHFDGFMIPFAPEYSV
jgi:hypothetical protein